MLERLSVACDGAFLVANQVKYIGYYDGEEEAAKAYDTAMLALKGNAAQTNFPAAEYAGDAIAKAEEVVWGQRHLQVRLAPALHEANSYSRPMCFCTKIRRISFEAGLYGQNFGFPRQL